MVYVQSHGIKQFDDSCYAIGQVVALGGGRGGPSK